MVLLVVALLVGGVSALAILADADRGRATPEHAESSRSIDTATADAQSTVPYDEHGHRR